MSACLLVLSLASEHIKMDCISFKLCVCVCTHMLQNTCGSQRTPCESQFSHSILWVPGILSSGLDCLFSLSQFLLYSPESPAQGMVPPTHRGQASQPMNIIEIITHRDVQKPHLSGESSFCQVTVNTVIYAAHLSGFHSIKQYFLCLRKNG